MKKYEPSTLADSRPTPPEALDLDLAPRGRAPRGRARGVLAKLAWRILAITVAWTFTVTPVFGDDVRGDGDYGFGQWVDVTVTPLCTPTNLRVCAEFVDKIAGSPYTGVQCCILASEVGLGRYDSCDRPFARPPRPDEDEEEEEAPPKKS